MRNMKDSGVEWIGEIPAHWDLVRLKSLIEARDGGAWGEEAAGRDGDMIWECSNCGHVVVGKKAPELCPVCKHPKSYFMIHATNF